MEKNSVHIFRQLYNGVEENELTDLGVTQESQPPIFANPNSESASLEKWMSFEKKGESDDRTMLIAFKGNNSQ